MRHKCPLTLLYVDILQKEDDLEFAALMAQNLNIILMTAPELLDSRKRLKDMATPESRELFCILYRCVRTSIHAMVLDTNGCV